MAEYVESFRKNNVAGWHQMEQQWLSRKHNPASSDKIRFDFPRSYSIWLKENHQDAFNAFDDDFGCTIIFSRQEIEEKVFKPVVDEIIAAAQESAQSVSKLDYIFLAGGLSGLAYLQNAVKESFAKSHPGAQVLFEHYSDHATALPGGSIMRGAAVILARAINHTQSVNAKKEISDVKITDTVSEQWYKSDTAISVKNILKDDFDDLADIFKDFDS